MRCISAGTAMVRYSSSANWRGGGSSAGANGSAAVAELVRNMCTPWPISSTRSHGSQKIVLSKKCSKLFCVRRLLFSLLFAASAFAQSNPNIAGLENHGIDQEVLPKSRNG